MSNFSFWSQNKSFVRELGQYLAGKRVLEVFAGNGLLASQLAEQGVDITATSLFKEYDSSHLKLHHPVVEMSATEAVLLHGSDANVLLMSWPEANNHAYLAAKMYFAMRGDEPSSELVFIGEKTDYSRGLLGGCATDIFFEQFGKVIHRFDSYQGNCIEVAEVLRPS
ncbi:hypothetical protein D3C87_466000 [compost metagenome]